MSIRETQILASMIDEPEMVTEEQIERWVCDFDNWEVRDQVCQNLFTYTKFAYRKAIEVAKEIQKIDSKSAKWIAQDAIRELTSEKIQERFKI
jgi:3-methyladenine DNA glycosylase AlkD